MKIHALVALALLGSSSIAMAAPADQAAHPAVVKAAARRAELRAVLDRLRLAREVAQAHAVAVSARAPRARVEVRVPTLKVQRPDLKIAVRCPAAAPRLEVPPACEVIVEPRRPTSPTVLAGGAEVPVTLD